MDSSSKSIQSSVNTENIPVQTKNIQDEPLLDKNVSANKDQDIQQQNETQSNTENPFQQETLEGNQPVGWKYVPCEFGTIDFEKYEKENLEHLKKVYKPPHISDIVEKVEQNEYGMKVQTYSLFNIPKTNVLELDMSFLDTDWEAKEIEPGFTMYSPKQQAENENEKELFSYYEDSSKIDLLIDKKWCRYVQVVYEERDQNGALIDKYRVTKEKRVIKIQGSISPKWFACLQLMKQGETKWFKMDEEFLSFNGQEKSEAEILYLKIYIAGVKALALSDVGLKYRKEIPQQQVNNIYTSYPTLLEDTENLNNEAKLFYNYKDYEQAAKIFLKAYSLWRGLTRQTRKSLTSEQLKTFVEKYNQFGGNHAQCLINMKKYQQCADFYKNAKLKSSKNLFKHAKCLYEINEFEKAVSVLDSYSTNLQDKSSTNNSENSTSESNSIILPPELQKLKMQCQEQIKKLEVKSIDTFYKNIFQ